ncbi:MAG: B12-binding domain-containing radical SAM protein [Proteobacteria bacterium]|nr:B12-binding domain-containing radical SAM protein [Pseudomonadota bacterium]MBU1057806.1 B12-binding domain-containing radical SAM protein [Pseudomonadota bacterium]
MNNIILVNPPLSLEERYGKAMAQFGAVTEPLGLAYIAGMLEKNHIPATIIDAQAEGFSIDQVVTLLADKKNSAIIGITLLTPMFGAVQKLSDAIKKTIPTSTIVLGGPHCTALKEQVLEEITSADIVCIGEGEETMVDIAQATEQSGLAHILGICYRDGKQIKTNEARPYIKNLDTISPPARHLLPMDKYHLTASRVTGDSYCPTIIVARGCPFSCTYCSRIFGRTLRLHSIERIISEIDLLIEQFDIKQLNIEADTLTANKKFLTQLCHALIDGNYNKKIKWTCESRVDTVDKDSLELMKKAGCWQISYGVETGNQRLLDEINKGTKLEQIEEVFKLTKKAGITIRGFFMLGLPTETIAESLATINFAKKIDPLWAQFTITTPYPGTKMFNELKTSGKILNFDWNNYNTWSGWQGEYKIPYISEGRTIEELRNLQKMAMRKFYLRPAVIWRFIKSVRSVDDMRKYIQGGMVLLKSKLS